MKTVHREKLIGHTDATLEEIPAIICDASRSSKSQENDPFHRNVWPGLYTPPFYWSWLGGHRGSWRGEVSLPVILHLVTARTRAHIQ